ncbi:hypothetical protein O6H91_08G081300 [Diphasiastrum complanatum]|nr:hypothetical protein O6H91_08G081300 [Diphasiastrum complanatum]KAJ7547343.1 hypothetical protein O6H91_08G081300 [Diphasiastrum complanatum]KAJ7547344.1 hypothetical protein O6H91_08G081300 [Diphasiastrum complanatum]
MAVNNVAVAVNSKENSRSAVKWTLLHLVSSSDVLTLIHVRPPVTHIPTPMGKMPVSQVVPEVVAAYVREIELKTDRLLKTYSRICEGRKVSTEIVVLEADSLQKALVQEIFKRGITKLILGAPSRNLFTKKFMGPGLPDCVSKNAPDFCSVYIISKQRLDSVKESRQSLERDNSLSSLSSTQDSESFLRSQRSSISSVGEIEVIELDPGAPVQSGVEYKSQPLPLTSTSGNHDIVPLRYMSVPHVQQNSNSPLLTSHYRPGEPNPSRSSNLHPHRHIDRREGTHDMGRMWSGESQSADSHPSAPYSDSGSVTSSCPQFVSNTDDQDLSATRMYDNVDTQYLCTNNAEQYKILSAVKAQEIAAKQLQEATLHLEALRALEWAKVRAEGEAQKLKEALAEAHFARQIAEEEGRRRIKAEAKSIKDEEAKVELTQALRKAEQKYRIYPFDEILAATNNLAEDHKLGEGGYGVVYKGKLHHTNVAIKVLKEDASQGVEEFQHEVEVLGHIHHPHMVLLLGCCPEKACIVYELMANGSLEDRLKCHGGTRPLPWYTRLKIPAEIATALFSLHSSKPEPIIHRDLKPGNILLDQNFVSKLADVGLATLIPESLADKNSTCFRDTMPVGTFAYIDPEYQHTGFFGPKSDVYAFGIVLLQLLTGRPPVGIIQFVKDSLESGSFPDVLDQSAGDWPLTEATQVAVLALECSRLKRKNRPDVASILPILDMIREYAEDWAAKSITDEEPNSQENAPELYICPILKEVMEDPVIAADGYTYEHAAIQQWLQEHDTSPLMNLPLDHRILTPNHSLRSAIREWMQGGRCSERYSL